MTDHELLMQLITKVDYLNTYYNHDITMKLTANQIDHDWIKWLLMFLVVTILAQAIILIFNSFKKDKLDNKIDKLDNKLDKKKKK